MYEIIVIKYLMFFVWSVILSAIIIKLMRPKFSYAMVIGIASINLAAGSLVALTFLIFYIPT